MLLQNDNVLLFLYEKLFPHSQLMSNGEFSFQRIKKQIQLQTDTSSRMSLLKMHELPTADKFSANIIHSQSKSDAQQTTLAGSRLNLNSSQAKEMEKLFPSASNYARKSYGGNTQMRYQTTSQDPVMSEKDKVAMKNLRSLGKPKSAFQ